MHKIHLWHIPSYYLEWGRVLQTLYNTHPPQTRDFFLHMHRHKPLAGTSGIGTPLFAQFFGLPAEKKSAYATSAIMTACCTVDDLLDREQLDTTEVVTMLDAFYTFLLGGRGFDMLCPLRDFLHEQLPAQAEQLFNALQMYKDAALAEKKAVSTDEHRAARITLGTAHGQICSTLIELYDGSLKDNQRTVIRNFSIGCSLLDSIADSAEDMRNNEQTHITRMLEEGISLTDMLSRETRQADDILSQGLEALPPHQQTAYKNLVRMAKAHYALCRLYKTARYGLSAAPLAVQTKV